MEWLNVEISVAVKLKTRAINKTSANVHDMFHLIAISLKVYRDELTTSVGRYQKNQDGTVLF